MSNDGGLRVRRDVQSLLAEGDTGRKVLDDYARAITAMRERDSGTGPPSDPLSWRFQAAIHGLEGVPRSVNHPKFWSSCRHNSWFFLPWHRLYLLEFERIVQLHLGDDTWSLPYWDYTKPDDESARLLPEPFRVPQEGNALWTAQREPNVNDPERPAPVPWEYADATGALKARAFTRDGDDPATTFAGGVVQDVIPVHRARGSLEGIPHGMVHGVVGGQDPPGLMSDFATAGLDPIFWLHHANIDRLWDVWIRTWGAGAMPSTDNWRSAKFRLFGPDGEIDERATGDLLVSENLGYEYESTEPRRPAGPRVRGRPDTEEERAPVPPKLVGAATEIPFSGRADVDIELTPPRGMRTLTRAASRETPDRWYLRVEDIVGARPTVPAYDVYVNVPEGERASDHPELRAGGVASFGIREASQPDSEHGGQGLTDVFDITDLVAELFDGKGWDPSALKVTVVPASVAGEVEEGGDVRAGRISVYAG
ncbi:MAG: tyrosinase family protein [Actinomycetota bacterium]|nr:tyrosinase family protein [Actinomycetota bacterium]